MILPLLQLGVSPLGPRILSWELDYAESEDETLEIQDKRKHENQVNEKILDMYTTFTLKTLPT